MTAQEANAIRRAFYRKTDPTEEDAFLYTEALDYLITAANDPHAMLELGGRYYEQRDFELALKYYTMAAQHRLPEADLCLGYIWYYGRTGERDFEKAFGHYSRAAALGSTVAAYKLADMYKNGYFVEKDPGRYREIIEELYPRVRNAFDPEAPLPEIFTRLAAIRAEQGRTDEAVDLYRRARAHLAVRIRDNAFFGNLTIMRYLIEDLYRLIPFDPAHCDLYDLYHVLRTPCTVRFRRGSTVCTVTVHPEGNAISFGEAWYRTVEDFFAKANINGRRLTSLRQELYGFEVIACN